MRRIHPPGGNTPTRRTGTGIHSPKRTQLGETERQARAKAAELPVLHLHWRALAHPQIYLHEVVTYRERCTAARATATSQATRMRDMAAMAMVSRAANT